MNDEPVYVPELIPVFPLPDVVLFPHALLPLHIFEPRYRTMTTDALLGERVIAIALLKPGFEPLYHTNRAPIHPILGVGRIVDSARAPGGTYNITLQGIARARIIEELPGRPYRLARVEVIETVCNATPAGVRELRSRLLDASLRTLSDSEESARRWNRLFASEMALGPIADLIASSLPTSGDVRQSLLAEADDARRASRVLDQIDTLAAIERRRRALSPTNFRQN